MSNNPDVLITFGSFRLCPAARTLTHFGEPVPLAPKTFDLLLLLSESRGRVLTKGELMGALWKEAFVEDANLGYQVSMLRKALGEEGAGWIETAPKIGYRFTAPVETVAPIAADAVAPGRRWLTPLLGGGLALMLAAGWGFQSFNRIRRARPESLPKIASLAEEGRFCAAFALANQTESPLGKGDVKLAELQREIARTARLDTEPSGAEVFYSDLRSSEKEWRPLGKTPLNAVSIPRGYFRLRFEKQGFETTYGLFGAVTDYRKYSLFPKTDHCCPN